MDVVYILRCHELYFNIFTKVNCKTAREHFENKFLTSADALKELKRSCKLNQFYCYIPDICVVSRLLHSTIKQNSSDVLSFNRLGFILFSFLFVFLFLNYNVTTNLMFDACFNRINALSSLCPRHFIGY